MDAALMVIHRLLGKGESEHAQLFTPFSSRRAGVLLLLQVPVWDGFPQVQPCLCSCPIPLLHVPST